MTPAYHVRNDMQKKLDSRVSQTPATIALYSRIRTTMEARKEAAPMPEREGSEPEQGALSESDLEQVDEFDVEKERGRMVQDKRERLAAEYEILREPLLELRGADDKESSAEYERVRTQFLRQIVEQYARGSIERSKEINDLAMANMKGKSGDYFTIGVEALVDIVTAMDDFNNRFDMLIENRPEGKDALPYLEKLVPEFYKNVKRSSLQKSEQLGGAKTKQEQVRDALRPAFDDIREMRENTMDARKPRPTQAPKKKGWFGTLFGGK